MTPGVATLLMESIAADRLTILCGAGLSMAGPSSAPSAAAVARGCFADYARLVGTSLADDLREDLEKQSLWFRQRNRFEDLFIGRLVPWAKFNGPFNPGHEAIADLLACHAASGVTTNYDRLVEVAAISLGEPDFQAIVDVEDLPRIFQHRPFLKVHGCSAIGKTRLATIWCKEQLADPQIRDRTARFRTWLESNLLGRDLLIVGFWSDWAYLSEVFASTLNAIGPRSIVLVDLGEATWLESKAPMMWAWAHQAGVVFHHERQSGADFLREFREHFSRVFIRRLMIDSTPTYQALFGSAPTGKAILIDAETIELLYALRRDLTGVPRNRPVRQKEAAAQLHIQAAIHARLADLGAVYEGHTYSFRGERIRLINGGGRLMSQVKADYKDEPPLAVQADRVICVGATPDPTPASVVRPHLSPSIIHGGVAGDWATETDLIASLGAGHV